MNRARISGGLGLATLIVVLLVLAGGWNPVVPVTRAASQGNDLRVTVENTIDRPIPVISPGSCFVKPFNVVTDVGLGTVKLFKVPAGKRLILEFITAQSASLSSSDPILRVIIDRPGAAPDVVHYISFQSKVSSSSTDISTATHCMRTCVEAEEEIFIQAARTGTHHVAILGSLSGTLVDAGP